MKHLFLVITILATSSLVVKAQSDVEALRYSSTMELGTARSTAMGNAMTAIGGEISSLNYNPAGLAQIGISEFNASGGFNVSSSKNTYLNTLTKTQGTSFQLNNFGLAYVPKRNFRSIKNITIAGSYHKKDNFNQKIQAAGINNVSSYSDIYSQELNNYGADTNTAITDFPFGSSLAYGGFLVDVTDDNFFYSIVDLPITQKYNIRRKGSHNEFAFGAGVAFNDQLSVGLSVGIPTIFYEETFEVTEIDQEGVTPDFEWWRKEDKFRTEATGIQATVGINFNPTPQIRLGASFTTPTRYNMKDIYRTIMVVDFEDYTYGNTSEPAEGYFNYKMTTPLKFNVGGAFLDPRWGLFSIEYNFSNPSKTKYIFSDYYDLGNVEAQLNERIRTKYKAQHTVKAGLEGIVAEHFRLRAGYQFQTFPFAQQSDMKDVVKNTRMGISGGIGYRGKNIYTDLTYMHVLADELMVPYSVNTPVSDAPTLVSKYNRGNVVLTVGFKF